jgi:cold shock CspA family protein
MDDKLVKRWSDVEDIVNHFGYKFIEAKDIHSRFYEKGDLVLLVHLFIANNAMNNYSSSVALIDKKKNVAIGMPYYMQHNRKTKQQLWRIYPWKIREDIEIMERHIEIMDSDGYFPATIYRWENLRGFGFATCEFNSKIFVHITDLPERYRDNPEGSVIKIKLLDDDENIKIKVKG